MVGLQPLVGHVVAAAHAADVVAPPFDLLTEERRRELVAARPDSFLRVLPPRDAGDAELRTNRQALERLLDTGRLVPMERPSLGVLSLEDRGLRTVALIGDVELAAFLDGRVLPHERVRPERVERLAHHLQVVGVASSPVCVVHRPTAAITALTDQLGRGAPDVVVDADDGVRLTLHLVTDAAAQREMAEAVDAAGTLFVADGHHRAAAVARHAARGDGRKAATGGTGPPGRVLTAVVPSDHLRLLAFHRRVDGLGDAAASSVLGELEAVGVFPEPLTGPSIPPDPGVIHLTAERRWWTIDLRDRRVDGPVESLDVRLVERELLEPLGRLGASPEGLAVVPVPDPLGLDALVRPGSIGLALHPPSIEDVLAVAEAGAVMPPKSTYLVPKLRSGLLVVPR